MFGVGGPADLILVGGIDQRIRLVATTGVR